MTYVAIIGGTGYTGVELVKILLRHSGARISSITTRQKKAFSLAKLAPEFKKSNLRVTPFDFKKVTKTCDAVFLCLPHKEAANTAVKFRQAGKVVIDLSADFRLKDARLYPKWYGLKHPQKRWLSEAVYGLPELNRKKIAQADLIANPGCYPTSAILGLAPLLKAKLIDPASIHIDAKSGVSGAGRKFAESQKFYGPDADFYAYKVGKHQHTPEIEQTLSLAAGRKVTVTFVTHLLPVHRGILSTMYAKLKKGTRESSIARALNSAYRNEPFVRLKKAGEPPTLKAVRKTNFCDLGFFVEARTNRIILMSAIDNLVKGASGQAVQNFNIRFGFNESEGLKSR